ncbi:MULTISPECIES: 4'-phosphopantetheinyl transferase family protein [Bacillus]|uniref:4-phosphopantetheinyl transferase n=1 Tax=Bacillus wiedmannii TaxID=1890302 RepID=A0A2B6KJW1_9BACI|nr:4'-phosphopantetheinyl transferase superfamily protein [Bacillus wiedmannii]MDF9663748.1 4'-phosphopantetheinyl transferase superfamily protein [Bacillus wiedmannii]MDI6504809.1 4'-phosphopantetheinyl transferase superfamily protein [Bacillus wiedmannii]MDI6510710.1 4'-phosphopantetheinyl transferase superfamily protein [Bacillus wiedmannii]PFZ20131.1 4-phosphopantetheinyl transferase [Bacillus wiedmannii]PGC15347.1 4-phosphopantetheinyl transferase [Bacillus wiedmannii]
MIKIQAFYIPSHINPYLFERLFKLVDLDKQKKINQFTSVKDSYRSLIGDIAIRLLVCQKYHISNNKIFYQYNKYNKPNIALNPPFFFNISHSGDWVVVISHTSEVGIDIEKIQDIDINISSKYFTYFEHQNLLSCKEEDRIPYFFDLWTLKESYIKFVGKGLSIPLNSFLIEKTCSEQFKIRNIHENFDNIENVFFKQYILDSNYSLSACAPTPNFPKDIEIFTIDDLKSLILRLEK